jgi:hypothetical protein
VRALLRFYPRQFRERYGSELVELLDASETRWRDSADLIRAALSLHVDNGLRALRRCADSKRPLLLALGVAAGAGAALSGSAGLGSHLAIAGCSVLGGTAFSAACAIAVAGPQLVSRALPRMVSR